MGSAFVTIVTGAVRTQQFIVRLSSPNLKQQNRGIGEAICQTIASNAQQPMILYATSRKGMNLGIKVASSDTQIEYHKLDITDPVSIDNLANLIKKAHGGCDVIINNAGINVDDQYSPQNVKLTLDTNYRGTLR
ncbi:hypothetical protein MMC26_000755, partial [Xylographa opegraphella]|nr:hypothetical protein [Xylographa opegraphella]